MAELYDLDDIIDLVEQALIFLEDKETDEGTITPKERLSF